jgi:hypothetical protein
MPTASATTLAAAPVKIVLNNFNLTMNLQFLPGRVQVAFVVVASMSE